MPTGGTTSGESAEKTRFDTSVMLTWPVGVAALPRMSIGFAALESVGGGTSRSYAVKRGSGA
jgi:hypothetical protein